MATISVLTQHNDNGRTGANLNETTLQALNVNVNEFGRLFTCPVQGQIYAQPLFVPFLQVTGVGVRHAVIVCTMQNRIYAFDADSGASLWERQLDPNPVPAQVYAPDYFDIADSAQGTIGILSTPVIDAALGNSTVNPTTGTLYLVLATWDPTKFASDPQPGFKQLLYAINLADGSPRAAAPGQTNPVAITGDYPGAGYGDPNARASNKPVDTSGGSAKVSVTLHQTTATKTVQVIDAEGGRVRFSPMQHMQRPGLLLQGGTLFIAFGSHGDFDPYHGWVFAYDAATLQRNGVFCTTPNGAKSGIWQAGEGLVADAAGNLYGGTGNGDTKTTPGSTPDLGESYFRLQPGAAGLALTGWVTAFQAGDPQEDDDLGAASPVLLPDGFLVGGGKDGNFYLFDPSKMTNAGSKAAVVQTFLASRGPGSRAPVFQGGNEVSTHHIHGSPVVYDSPEHGPLVYVWGENDVLRVYRYDPAAHTFPGQPNQRNQEGTPLARGAVFASNDVPQHKGMPGAMLAVSANGQTPGTAILWASLPPFLDANHQVVDGELIAYSASQFDAQGRAVLLWRSHQNPDQDDYGKFAKFCCPTVANGKVYQATFSNRLDVYGLRAVPDGGYNFAFGRRSDLTLNGSARSDGGPVRLTGQHLFQAGSVFCTAPVDVRRFTTTFRFLLSFAQADGLTFTVQGEGPHALGGPGGGLGYAPDPDDPFDPGFLVTKSVAVKFDLFDNPTAQQTSSTGLLINGVAQPGLTGDRPLAPQGINFHSGNHFAVTINYDGTSLTVTINDEKTLASAMQTYLVDIPGVTGANAFVGFTGATGGLMAEQDILQWDFATL